MRLLKKFGGLDLYKKVEETLDAIYPDLGSGNKPPFIHFRSTNVNGTSWIKPPSGNDYEACWRGSWDAGNKDFSWDAWKWVRNCHDPKCDAAFWIEWAETWQMRYTEAAAAARSCDLCLLTSKIAERYVLRINLLRETIIMAINQKTSDSLIDCRRIVILCPEPKDSAVEDDLETEIHVNLFYPEPSKRIYKRSP